MINIDINKTGFENLVDLIVANNDAEENPRIRDIDDTTITFDAPNEVIDPEAPEVNTSVLVNSILDAGFSGDVTVTYYRPTLQQIHTTPEEQVEVFTGDVHEGYVDGSDPDYHAAVLLAVAEGYGLRTEDIEIEFDDETNTIPVPQNENDPQVLNIKPKVTSFLYSGAAFQVTFAALDTDVPLDTVIVNTALTGFDY